MIDITKMKGTNAICYERENYGDCDCDSCSICGRCTCGVSDDEALHYNCDVLFSLSICGYCYRNDIAKKFMANVQDDLSAIKHEMHAKSLGGYNEETWTWR